MEEKQITVVQVEAEPSSHNRVELSLHRQDFVQHGQKFEVSGRYISPNMTVREYLALYFDYLDPRQIKSIFANPQYPSLLYGGRTYNLAGALTDEHLAEMNQLGIGLNLTLSNHFFDEDIYQQNKAFLARHHKPGNSIICVNDKLARRIREDFPQYQLIASLIKHAHTHDRVVKALALYDEVVIPMDMNDDDAFLQSLPDKHRIILFANANCAYNCPSRSCYAGFSQANRDMPVTGHCSIPTKQRMAMGHVYFDVAKFRRMGFSYFKLVPPHESQPHEPNRTLLAPVEQHRNQRVSRVVDEKRQQGKLFFICSYPKAGRTWLRFMLAHYLALKFELGIQVNLQSIFTLLPNSDRGIKGIESYQFADRPEMPLILFSHSDGRPGTPMIGPHHLLVRGVEDVVVSDYFHQSKLLENFTGTLKEYIRAEEGGLQSYIRYLNSWVDRQVPAAVSVLSYEQLHQQPEQVLSALLHQFGLPVDLPLIEQAVELSRFDRMRQAEDSHGIAGHAHRNRGDEGRRVRKGKVGGYRDYLDDDDVQFIRQRCQALLSPAAQELLKTQGLWEGN